MTSTATMDKNAGYCPRTIASMMLPRIWPEEPVPGIVKLIICPAKTNAPITPIKATL